MAKWSKSKRQSRWVSEIENRYRGKKRISVFDKIDNQPKSIGRCLISVGTEDIKLIISPRQSDMDLLYEIQGDYNLFYKNFVGMWNEQHEELKGLRLGYYTAIVVFHPVVYPASIDGPEEYDFKVYIEAVYPVKGRYRKMLLNDNRSKR